MNNYSGFMPAINGALFALIIIASTFILQFYLSMDLDKYFAVIIAASIYIYLIWLILNGVTKLKKSNETFYLGLGIFLIIVVYFMQFLIYGIAFNTNAFTLLIIILTPLFYKITTSMINYEIFFKLTIIGYFIFLVPITFIESGQFVIPKGGYSSNLFFLIFCISLFNKSPLYRFLLYTSLLSILLLQVRIHYLAVFAMFTLIYLKDWSNLKRVTFFIVIILALYLLFLITPDLRIFQTHTSGRLTHWSLILNNFDISSLLYGMGAGSSRQVLVDHGISHSMNSAHNEFIRYGFDLGLLGLSAVICILRLLFIRKNVFTTTIIIAVILQMLTDNIFTYYFNYLLPLLLYCCHLDSTNGRRHAF